MTIALDFLPTAALFIVTNLIIVGAKESGPWKENLHWGCWSLGCDISIPIEKFYRVRKVGEVFAFFVV
jgi:hypothetical protein